MSHNIINIIYEEVGIRPFLLFAFLHALSCLFSSHLNKGTTICLIIYTPLTTRDYKG